jgi:acetyl esterase/lipase
MKLHAWLTAVCILTFTTTTFGAGLPKEEPLWPAGVPDKTLAHERAEKNTLKLDEKTGKAGGGASFVSTPTMMVFPAPKEKATRAAIVVFPGGGYRSVVLGKEGVTIAQRLNAMGITAIVVKYRTMVLADVNIRPTPAQYRAQVPTIITDGKRAVRIVRSRAAELGIDPNKIGVMGFSAGSHLSASLMAYADAGDKTSKDAVEKQSCRPDFACLIYGGLGPDQFDLIKPGIGPCFMAIAANDEKVEPNSVTRFFEVLNRAHVPTELHVYQSGGHGFGIGKPGETNAMWLDEFSVWLKQNGFVR